MDNTTSKVLRIYSDLIKKSNMMASPAREMFITELAQQMDEAAEEFDKVEKKFEIRRQLSEFGKYEDDKILIS